MANFKKELSLRVWTVKVKSIKVKEISKSAQENEGWRRWTWTAYDQLKEFQIFFFNWAPRCTSFEKDILIHMDWEKPCITFH